MTSVAAGREVELGLVRAALAADYEVLDEIGRGGMAVVYRAREKALDREVAIKVLPAAMTIDPEFVERFLREARTAGRLEHPHIVPIYRVGQAGESGQVIYFVMKLLRGMSLAAVLRERGRLDVSDLRRVLVETASALGYAAKQGVVHRDVKPDNILLDSEGRCVVTDFGIAKTASGPMTAQGLSMGTPRYMSPEHAQGTPVDGRSDLYSLGVVAYECLTGQTPFNADDPFAILFKHINDTLPRPTLTTDEEHELFAVIERMLAKAPEGRFQTADDVITALGGPTSTSTLVSAVPLMAHGLTPTQVMTTPMWRRPWTRRLTGRSAAWAVAAAAVALSAVTYAASRAAVGAAAAGAAGAAGMAAGRAADSAGATTSARPAAAAALPAMDSSKRSVAQASVAAAVTPAAPAPAPKPPPAPYSRCPRLKGDAATATFSVLVDPISKRAEGSRVYLAYDVCGLNAGAPFTTDVTVTKVNQSRFRRMIGKAEKPVTASFVEKAINPRTRRYHSIDTRELSSGDYSIKVLVTDGKARTREKSRDFTIVEKK